MSCSVCHEKGYYLLTADEGEDYEIVLCDCQATREREGNGSL